MEGPRAPRGTAREIRIGFRETPGGGSLALGHPRYYLGVGVVAGSLLALGALMGWLSSTAAGDLNPGGPLALRLVAVTFIGLGCVMLVFVALSSGRWTLNVDEEGVRLERSHRRPKAIPWPSVKRVEYAPTVIQMGRYGAGLGDAIRIDAHYALAPIFLDTVHFRIPADEIDRMAAVLKEFGGRHGARVEPFPMAGRDAR